jgi:hypothetical protein
MASKKLVKVSRRQFPNYGIMFIINFMKISKLVQSRDICIYANSKEFQDPLSSERMVTTLIS